MKKVNGRPDPTCLLLLTLLLFTGGGLLSVRAEQRVEIVRQTGKREAVGHAPLTLSQVAKMWGLTAKEYTTYVRQLATTPSGRWWRHVDPPQVLGMNATTEAERRRFAAIDAKLAHIRAEKELAFQHCYAEVYTSLYPHEHPIRLPTQTQTPQEMVRPGDHFYLFTARHDWTGTQLAIRLSRVIQERYPTPVFLHLSLMDSLTPENKPGGVFHLLGGKKHQGITLNADPAQGRRLLQHLLRGRPVELPVLVRVRKGRSRLIAWAPWLWRSGSWPSS